MLLHLSILLIVTHSPHLITSISLPKRIASADPYILCTSPPPNHLTGLPDTYPESSYNTSLALCSSAHGAPQNAGCVCTSSGGLVRCIAANADPGLYHTVLNEPAGVTIPEFCAEVACYCATLEQAQQAPGAAEVNKPQVAKIPRSSSSAVSATVSSSLVPRVLLSSTTTSTSSISSITGTREYLPTNVHNDPVDPAGPNPFANMTSIPFAEDIATSTDGCGLGCHSNRDCDTCSITGSTSQASTFMCRAAQQSQVDPQSGAIRFVSMCLVAVAAVSEVVGAAGESVNGGGRKGRKSRKRDSGSVGLPCPCNGTYISHGCCQASEGLVWEPAGWNLGQLVVGKEL